MNRDEFVKRIFSVVAPHIDFLSCAFSFGLVYFWRRKILNYIMKGDQVLDLCTGTGELAFLISKRLGRTGSVIGLDVNHEMLEIAKGKVRKNPGNISFIESDARAIPFPDNSFDVVTVAFGIRNIPDPVKAINECLRIIKPGGRLICLELMKPEDGFFKRLWRFYVFRVIPSVGGLIIGDPLPYKYLPASIEAFYSRKEFIILLGENGLRVLKVHSMTCGVANIFLAIKPVS